MNQYAVHFCPGWICAWNWFPKMIRIISKKKMLRFCISSFPYADKIHPKKQLKRKGLFWLTPYGYSPSQRGHRCDGVPGGWSQRLRSRNLESDRPAAFSFLGSSGLKLMVWSFLVLGCLNCPRESLPHSCVQRPTIMYSLTGASRGLSPRGL